MAPIVYLISGANRGIGLAIVTALASRADTIVFAGARNPSSATKLQALAHAHSRKVYVVQLASCDQAAHKTVTEQIKREAGRLDVVIANAGLFNSYGSAFDTTPDEMREHFDINVVGPHILFQATYPLLQASTPAPKFIVISSIGGSVAIGPGMMVNNTACAVSKASVNYLARKLHFENEGLVCFPMNPGVVATDLMAWVVGQDESIKNFATISPEESAAGILQVVDASTREKDGGKFLNYDGSALEW